MAIARLENGQIAERRDVDISSIPAHKAAALGWKTLIVTGEGDQVSVTFDETTITETRNKSLTRMQALIDIERDRRLEKFTFANIIYDFDEVSRNRIDKARGSALAAIIAGAEANDLRWADANNDFGWIAADNSFNTMDAPTTLAFGNAAAAWEGLHIVAARNLKNLDPIPEGYANDQYWPSA